MKKTFRFHKHAWIDIIGKGDTEEEALENAKEKYEFGSYNREEEGSEDIDIEDITDAESGNLPY